MMETKRWIALCALLLINSGSVEPGDDHVTAATPEASAAGSVPASSPHPISRAATAPSANGPDTTPRATSSLSSDAISPTAEPKKDNDTNSVSPSEAAVAEKNLTHQSATQPPVPPSGPHAPTSHIPHTSTTTSTTHAAYTTPVDKPTTIPPTTTSHHDAPPLPDSITPSNQPAHPKAHSSPSVPTSETPETTTTTTIAQSSSTSSTGSPPEAPNSESPMLTSPQNTSQPDEHPDTASVAHPKSTTTLPSSTIAQGKAHADTPSQLNVGGDTTMVHESPTLDPLLAGLVSAFIITAVIITLLLFLKLRRRDNRPEFHRLQDLPMDDMMEDTPLSMYSY